MAANKQINTDVPNLLTANSKAVEKAYRNAVKSALLKHKLLNNPVAVWRDGKVVLLSAEEILPGK